ncbi:hypothetical protein CLOM_g17143 [Closterium sp. NIES-68]|nr:hypothetical protein CLOM_g17143 [Closterium sp. NIES-68]
MALLLLRLLLISRGTQWCPTPKAHLNLERARARKAAAETTAGEGGEGRGDGGAAAAFGQGTRGTGSLAWKAIGRMLERRNPNHPVLPAVWVRAVLNTHLAVNEEGTGTDVDSLELFDWSLESLLVTLPMGPEAAASLSPNHRLSSALGLLCCPGFNLCRRAFCSAALQCDTCRRATGHCRPRGVHHLLAMGQEERRAQIRGAAADPGAWHSGHEPGAAAAGFEDWGAPLGMDHAQPCFPAAAL